MTHVVMHIEIRNDNYITRNVELLRGNGIGYILRRTRVPYKCIQQCVDLMKHGGALHVWEWRRRGNGDFYINVTDMDVENYLNICVRLDDLHNLDDLGVTGLTTVPDDLEEEEK